MSTPAIATPSAPAAGQLSAGENGLVPQPERPSQFPVRVPVQAECNGVLLLQAAHTNRALPPLGTPVRLRVDWDRQLLTGRLAAHGVASRFLVTLGERAIRRSRRFPVDLRGTVSSGHLYGPIQVRIVDLSTGGARIEGLDLPIGSELQLCFTPPGRPAPINVHGFIVRAVETPDTPSVGVAFRLVQPSIDVLGRPGARN